MCAREVRRTESRSHRGAGQRNWWHGSRHAPPSGDGEGGYSGHQARHRLQRRPLHPRRMGGGEPSEAGKSGVESREDSTLPLPRTAGRKAHRGQQAPQGAGEPAGSQRQRAGLSPGSP